MLAVMTILIILNYDEIYILKEIITAHVQVIVLFEGLIMQLHVVQRKQALYRREQTSSPQPVRDL